MQPYKTCTEPAQEAASGETGVDPDSCMNRPACIYVMSAVTEINKKKGEISVTGM